MKLYLVRHGEPLSRAEDPRCSLSPAGRAQVRKVAGMLVRMNVRVGLIECSTKQRAKETAEILADAIGARDRVVSRKGLAPNDSIETVQKDLMEASEDRMLVGHLPYMEATASALLGGPKSRIQVSLSPGAMLCLSGDPGVSWRLDWMVYPEMLE